MEDVVAGGADGIVAEVEVLQGVQVLEARRDLSHHHVHQVQGLQRVAAVPELSCPGTRQAAQLNFAIQGDTDLNELTYLGTHTEMIPPIPRTN